jgi:DNA-binding response OmpR family regulator
MSNAKYRALLVDDEPSMRKLAATVFQRAGFECDLAANGRQALELLGSQTYDVMVTYLRMPDVNGHQVAVELLEKTDRPVVIVATGVTEPRIERDLRFRGVDEMLIKPVDYRGLAARVKSLIEQRAAQNTSSALTVNTASSGLQTFQGATLMAVLEQTENAAS